tara:strand:- start:2282 stop:2827 length:546 start_codon:yes stop_codon:yes gene_type:complete
MNIKSLTIYCSSSNNLNSDYYKLAETIGIYLAKKSIKIIYGGGSVGMMGKVSKAAFKSNGNVVGIIPEFLINKEIVNTFTTKTIIVKNMLQRKKKLFNLGDGFLILPGGSGTIEEATEIISWKLLGLHNKEIIIFNYKNYWNELIKTYQKAKVEKFGNKNLQNICKHIKTIQEFKNLFHNV